jgi:hypothetical protein
MSAEPAPRLALVMLGAPDAALCEDDSCLLPGADANTVTRLIDPDPPAPSPPGESQQRRP